MGQIMKIYLKDHASFLKIKPYLEPICVDQSGQKQKIIFFSKKFSDLNQNRLKRLEILY
jgi:hypothetical protein